MSTTKTAADIQAEFAKSRVQRCSIGKFLDEQPDDKKSVLLGALADEATISSREWVRVVRVMGLASFGEPSVNKHRRGDCRCTK